VTEAKGAGVRQEWSPEELLVNWTLVDGGWVLGANKSGATRLGFSLLLKFFELEGRFPDVLEEVPPAAVEYVADLVKVPATDFTKYTLVGRTGEYHRKQIREAMGFRPSTVADEKALAEWLALEVCPVELVEGRQREALLVECRARKIEPPGRTRVEKAWRARTGARRSSTTGTRSSASRTSCAFWSRRGTRSVAERSMSRMRPAGAIRRTTCPATSRPPARCTTPRSVSR
jgi:hypothetical protein